MLQQGPAFALRLGLLGLHEVLAEGENIGLHRTLQIALQALELGGNIILAGLFDLRKQVDEQSKDEDGRPQQHPAHGLLIHRFSLLNLAKCELLFFYDSHCSTNVR